MASEPTSESPGAEGAGAHARREEATLFVTSFVDKFADVTATWLKDSAKAFNSCFETAQRPGYTADQLVKDMADMWARNVEYLGRLVQVSVPDRSPPGSEAPGGQPRPGASEPGGQPPPGPSQPGTEQPPGEPGEPGEGRPPGSRRG